MDQAHAARPTCHGPHGRIMAIYGFAWAFHGEIMGLAVEGVRWIDGTDGRRCPRRRASRRTDAGIPISVSHPPGSTSGRSDSRLAVFRHPPLKPALRASWRVGGRKAGWPV